MDGIQMSFGERWKQYWCEHHWHTEPKTHRKIPSGAPVVCEKDEDKKYIIPGVLGLHEIAVRYIRECCHCEKREIHTTWYEATIPEWRDKALSYPDINDSPLEL